MASFAILMLILCTLGVSSLAQPISQPPVNAVSQQCLADVVAFKNMSYVDSALLLLYSGHGPQQLGNYDECQDLKVAHYCVFKYVLPGLEFYTVQTGVCAPTNCSDADLTAVGSALLPNTTKLSVMCIPKKITEFPAQAIAMLSILGALALLCAIGAIVEWRSMRLKQQREVDLFMMELDPDSEASHLLSVQADTYQTQSDKDEATVIVLPKAATSVSKTVRAPMSPSAYRRPVASVKMVPPPIHTEDSSKFVKFLLCFSPIRNLGRLFAPSSEPNLAALNGLRSFSMLWILLGHTIYYSSFMFDNPIHILNVISRQFEFQVIANANYAVDSFFYMTGFLVGYLTLRQLIKHRKIPLLLYYLHRIWRLTPPLIMMILTLWLLSPYLGNGPWWYNFKQNQLRNCNANWWASLLYINNFYPTDFMTQCGEWTWFSAVDMQFYIISPIIVYTYWRNKKIGLALMGALLTATLIATGIFAFQKRYTVNVLDIQESSDFSYMSEFYEKPWTRLPAYLVGMLSAFILIYIEDNPDSKTRAAIKWAEKHHEPVKRHMPWWLQTVLLISGLTIIFSCGFGTYSSFQPGQAWTYNDARTILWNTFGRVGFACGLAFMMHVLYMGHGYFINRILSWDAWSPIARLTYSAYLWHPVVMQVILSNFKTLVHYDYWTVTCYFLAFSAGSYIVALGSFLLIERPIMNLESLVLPQHK